jgi:hypothetical protein
MSWGSADVLVRRVWRLAKHNSEGAVKIGHSGDPWVGDSTWKRIGKSAARDAPHGDRDGRAPQSKPHNMRLCGTDPLMAKADPYFKEQARERLTYPILHTLRWECNR